MGPVPVPPLFSNLTVRASQPNWPSSRQPPFISFQLDRDAIDNEQLSALLYPIAEPLDLGSFPSTKLWDFCSLARSLGGPIMGVTRLLGQ